MESKRWSGVLSAMGSRRRWRVILRRVFFWTVPLIFTVLTVMFVYQLPKADGITTTVRLFLAFCVYMFLWGCYLVAIELAARAVRWPASVYRRGF